MRHIVCFSGGKDSTALVLWAKENLPEFTTVFCDTGWEHPITYAYVEEINQKLLGGSLIYLQSEKYFSSHPIQPLRSNATERDKWRYEFVIRREEWRKEHAGFWRMCCERKMVPGVKTRFCTQELKVFPLHEYFQSLDDEVTSYQGIRADESKSRAAMTEEQWLDDAGGYWIKRPLLRWTAEQCFDMMREHGVKPNPLYLLGSSRVGCFPCIMTGLGELKRLLQFFPELKQRLIELERDVNIYSADRQKERDYSPRTFFRTDTIPARFCKNTMKKREPVYGDHGEIVGETIRIIAYPTAQDVFRYIESVDENQLPLLPARSCMSVYNLCE